jgi:TRAP-type mannitol/chloroaromatic compound transport system substrate-binding protein
MKKYRGSLTRFVQWSILVGSIILTLVAFNSARADIQYRSFSSSAAIGPPADDFAAELSRVSRAALGSSGEIRFVRLPGLPSIPAQFSSDIVAAVAAGRSGGGFDAAYISGSDLNRAWGFIYNSGVPFGPTFDEFVGFLYGQSIDGGAKTGLDLAQDLLDLRNRGVVAIPIVGSPEQLSGYFPEPMDDVRGHRGIGLAGLCQAGWTLRYLPPGQDILVRACDDLIARGRIRSKDIAFIQAVPGGGSLVDATIAGTIQGFEFATPMDDVSQLFLGINNPGTVGVRFVHTPGWQQQFLITWMIVNQATWNALSSSQQVLARTVARGHVLSSYAENLRQQGAALGVILGVNHDDGDPGNGMVLSRWSDEDQARLREATIDTLHARSRDSAFAVGDRIDYDRVVEALRLYVRSNDLYWSKRQVDGPSRFLDWTSPSGQCWTAKCDSHARRH